MINKACRTAVQFIYVAWCEGKKKMSAIDISAADMSKTQNLWIKSTNDFLSKYVNT